MYKCNNCEKEFEEYKVKEYKETSEYWGTKKTIVIKEAICPHCGDDDIEEFELEEDELHGTITER